MKKYNVTVNGTVYEVLVEEADVQVADTAPAAPSASAVPAAPAAPKTAVPAGGRVVKAPMPGTILKMNVKEGDEVKADTLVCILEAMKMENEIFAGADGTVKAINVSQGASVNSGDPIVTLG